jgi:hypothetical protein
MKFGKRRWEAKIAAQEGSEAPPPAPVPESWTVRSDRGPAAEAAATPAGEPETVVDGEAVELPITDAGADEPAPAPAADEPADDLEADFDFPRTAASEPEPAPRPEPEPEPAPVAAEPDPAPEPEPVDPEPEPVPAAPAPVFTPPARAPGEALPPPGASWAPASPPMPFPVAEEPVLVYTSESDSAAVSPLSEAGAAHASGHAPGTSPSWPEPVLELAAERPEVVVGAAFAGGLLLAMILRRLGN